MTKTGEITFPASVKHICYGAFYRCQNIVSVNFPDDLKTIDSFAFGYCSSLKDIILPESVTKTAAGAFIGCGSASKLYLPEGLRNIEENAFRMCSSLTEVYIPENVNTIGDFAFAECDMLETIDVAKNNKSGYYSLDGVLYCNIGDYNMLVTYPCSKAGTFDVPENIDELYWFSFYKCHEVTSVNIGKNTSIIHKATFAYTDKLKEMSVDEENEYFYSYDNMLFTAGMLQMLACPGGKEGEITLPDKILFIDQYAFAGCDKITKVSLSDNLAFIDDLTFADCSRLETVDIPRNTDHINYRAFLNCFSLKEIYIPMNVVYISDYAFEGCEDITIYCNLNSYAAFYAYTSEIPYVYVDVDDTYDVPEIPIDPNKPEWGYSYYIGDINNDGRISSADSLIIQRYTIGLEKLDEIQQWAGDVNIDYKVDNRDALLILRHSIGLDNDPDSVIGDEFYA